MTVTLRVPEGRSRFYADAPPGEQAEVDSILDMTFSYDNPEAEYSAMAPPVIHLYERGTSSAAMGLAGRAEEALEAMGYEAETVVEGDRSGPFAPIPWDNDIELRGYQEAAVDAVLDERGGIVALPTGAGKTVTAIRVLSYVVQRSLVLVHTKELLHQWAEEIRGLTGVEPGVIGDGEWSEGGEVTVATAQTLMSKGTHRLDDYGVVVFDECHRTSAADQMHDIGMGIDAEWRIGLSATPWRKINGEELKIEGAVGPEVITVTAEDLIADGWLAEPRFRFLDHDGPEASYRSEYHEAYERCVEKSDPRNRVVAEEAERLADDGYRVLVDVNRISQGEDICERLGGRARFLSGSDRTPRREDVIGRYESEGGIDVLVSTLLREGVDIPGISAIVLAGAGKSDIQQIQTIGRALRPSNGDHAVISDVRDKGRYFGDQFNARVSAMNEYYGSYGPGDVRGARTNSNPTRTGDGDGATSLSEPMSEEEEEEMLEWLTGDG